MTPSARARLRILLPLLGVSLVGWIAATRGVGGFTLPDICASVGTWLPSPTDLPVDLALALNPPLGLALGWAVMLVAMMPPLLAAPLRHVLFSSFAARRWRATLLFVSGYLLAWMLAGAVLIPVALLAHLIGPAVSAPVLIAAALIWQISPRKQRALNRCHASPSLPAFGARADMAVLAFGLRHGGWCVASCWALMLLPLLVQTGHGLAMLAAMAWMIGERLETPTAPRWAWRWPAKAMRILRARLPAARRPRASPT